MESESKNLINIPRPNAPTPPKNFMNIYPQLSE